MVAELGRFLRRRVERRVVLSNERRTGYLPIANYGAIGNLRTVALVGTNGSIDWLCIPETPSPSVFAALLDPERGGRFRCGPVGGVPVSQHYLEDTNVLVTSFVTTGGARVRVIDFMPIDGDIVSGHAATTWPELHRLISCDADSLPEGAEIEVEWSPRFDYARAETSLALTPDGYVARASGGQRLALSGVRDANGQAAVVLRDAYGPTLRARMHLPPGGELALVCSWSEAGFSSNGAAHPADAATTKHRLDRTVEAWRKWLRKEPAERVWSGPWRRHVVRSELTLKLLVHVESGAFVAAPTTSLPECIGGIRNYDYRYCWLRDASLMSQALEAIGHADELEALVRWVERVSEAGATDGGGLSVLYGIHGEQHLPVVELDHLAGYMGSRPVQIGNDATEQRQLDIFAELLTAGYVLSKHGRVDETLARFLARVADRAAREWQERDYGVWEMRNGPSAFVYSKVKVWEALVRAIGLARRGVLRGDVARWRSARDAIRKDVLMHAYDDDLGAFKMAYERPELDAANLLVPMLEFLPVDDPRVVRTVHRTLEALADGELVYRYRSPDGLPGDEGAFLACSFWMVDVLALSGRVDEAAALFEALLRRSNHLGLFAEQIDPQTGAFLGNFPQAFSHVGLLNSALYVAYAQGRREGLPTLIGTEEHRRESRADRED
jgi:GH15 family glucan-1,4-alpha-glucosidase